MNTPHVVAFLYVKYVSPQKGFGLFSGEDIPRMEKEYTPACLGTYGGMVCGGEREALHPKTVYNMTSGHLSRSPEPLRANELERLTLEEREEVAKERYDVFFYTHHVFTRQRSQRISGWGPHARR